MSETRSDPAPGPASSTAPAATPAASGNGLAEHLKEDIWGIYVISKREFWSNIRSFRSLVMVAILALIMVGASMGFAGLSTSEKVEEAFMYQLVASDPDGVANDLVVFVYKVGTYEPLAGRNVTLLVENMEIPDYDGNTDDRGIFVAKDLTPAFHWLYVDLKEEDGGGFTTGMGVQFSEAGGYTYVYVPHNLTVPYPSLGVIAKSSDISGNERLDDVVVHVVAPSGDPIPGANVLLGELTNTTNVNGICTFIEVDKGEHMVMVTAPGNLSGLTGINVTHQRTETDPFAFALEGPDQVLSIVAAIAIGIIGPIYAIVLCFDSVFRERLSGSIDYLLCRPMGRRAVLIGKFTGILAALMVPITATSLIAVAVIAWISGENPTTSVVVGYLIYTVFLIAIFVLLQMVFSTVAKTTGTAILSGIGIWIFFFMLFNLILILVVELTDMSDADIGLFFNRASFFNPISIYSMAIDQLVSGTAGTGIPDWAPGAALVVLTGILLVAAMEIFRRRVTE